MKTINILGIYREKIFSNRAVEADRAILDAVLISCRKKLGNLVNITAILPEEFILLKNNDYDLIFSMSQDEGLLLKLDSYSNHGSLVINSATAIRSCYRNNLSEHLSDKIFSYPRFISQNINSDLIENLDEHPVWIKRGDFHALVDDDVIFAENANEKQRLLMSFKSRGVKQVILQEHCEGELFKFYGVRDSFFNIRYMGKTGRDRYEFVPGNNGVDFDRTRLEILAHKAARILDLDFYGGDCIIDELGKMHFIDFNDWPSYRTCKDEVAPIMVNYALKKLNFMRNKIGVSDDFSFIQRI